MTIQWGSWSSNNRLRCGIELSMSPSTVGTGTTSVTVTAKIYLQTRYASTESGSSDTWFASGDITGSGNTDWSLGDMGTKLMGTVSKSFATSYTSETQVDVTGRIHSYFAYPGTDATAYTNVRIPKRPVTAPAAPSGLAVARVSDSQQSLTWTRNATTSSPYDSQSVQRKTLTETVWTKIATVSGTATSWADTGTMASRSYIYRVYASNSAGNSLYSNSASIDTTPSTPPTPTAAKNTAGDIVVSWPAYTSMSASDLEVWHAADGVWDGAPLATLAATATSYTHAGPSTTVVHSYRLRGKSNAPVLSSAYSGTSGSVQLLGAPNAPTNLTPSGVTSDAAADIGVSWKHNPVDTTPQRKRQLRWRVNGGAWDERPISTSSTQSTTITAGTWANGVTVEWQARTWGSATTGGADGTGASPWSATATITTSSAPVSSANTPDGTAAYASSTLTVTWGYFQAEGSTQAAWQARLKNASGTVLQTRSGSGTASSTTFTLNVADATTYQWDVRVQSAAGLWSAYDAATFDVAYARPPVPSVVPLWLPDTGAVTVQVDVPGPGEGEVAAVAVSLWRDSGDGWVLVAQDVTPGASVTDCIPPLGATVAYRAQAVSALPSTSVSDEVPVFTDGAKHVFVNGGPGFSQLVRLISNVVVDVDDGLAEKTLHQFAGRPAPVEFAGEATTLVFGIAATEFAPWVLPSQDQSSLAEVRALARLAGPHCYRSPDGERVFVSMSGATGQKGVRSVRPLAFTLTQVDWAEPAEDAS